MIALKQMIDSADILSNGLKINGRSHKNYKIYTSMERAMEFMLSGYMYLVNGSFWNDRLDRDTMKRIICTEPGGEKFDEDKTAGFGDEKTERRESDKIANFKW